MKLHLILMTAALLGACASVPPVVGPCTKYCASYEEGYQWAGASNLSDDRNCSGYTDAFSRGCRQQIQDRLLSIAPGHDGL